MLIVLVAVSGLIAFLWALRLESYRTNMVQTVVVPGEYLSGEFRVNKIQC